MLRSEWPQARIEDLSRRPAIIGLLALTLVTYIATLGFGWVYDDVPQVAQNPNLFWSHLGSFFTHHLWASGAGFDARFYRPGLQVWFLLNKSLFGLNPHWFHFTTVLAHVAATGLAFLVARILLRNFGGAWFAAAVFGLHPLHAETASWISDVDDSLAAIFAFATFLAYIKATTCTAGTKLWWSLAAVFLVLGLLLKEIFVVVPAIVIVHWLTSGATPEGRRKTQALAIVAGSTVIGALYLLVRYLAIGSGTAQQLPPLSWTTVLMTAPYLLSRYVAKVLAPWGLSPHYDVATVVSPLSTHLLLGVITVLALLGVAALAIRRWSGAAWTALAWFVLPLLPALNAGWLSRGDYLHDRYLYLSLFGVALLAALALMSAQQKWPHSPGKMVAVVLVAAMALASALQSLYWANDSYLFWRGVQIAPHNEWAQLNYGSALFAKGQYAQAAKHFTRSYELAPGWRAAEYAGMAQQRLRESPAAEKWFATALQLNPDLPEAWFALARIQLDKHQPEPAIEMLQRALRLQNDALGYHYLLGEAFEQANQPAAALQAYAAELALHPQQIGALRAIERLKRKAGEQQ